MYALIRPLLFSLPPEFSHSLVMQCLSALLKIGILPDKRPALRASTDVMGLSFANSLGLAAGFDKNADFIAPLSRLGFGFIEVGTVTPRPQAGNDKPRLFRLPEAQALINRMGFNNKGIDYVVERLKMREDAGVIGVNIGKNFSTPLSQAVEDYVHCLQKVYEYADYITINISSPNTPNLRDLQLDKALIDLLLAIKREQNRLQKKTNLVRPIVVKIAPDLSESALESLAHCVVNYEFDGIIATNTTISRDKISQFAMSKEKGGLSGAPLSELSLVSLYALRAFLPSDFPVISVGGIMSGDDALSRKTAGASLLQIYSGLIYHGPAVIKDILSALALK